MACSATSPNFYLPPRYETPTLDVNISLNMANLHMINILANQRLGKPDKLSQGAHNQTSYLRVQWDNTLDKREATEPQG